jgi:hypothetical protein
LREIVDGECVGACRCVLLSATELISKRARSTTPTSLRFRINNVRSPVERDGRDCHKSSNVPRSLTSFSSIAAPVTARSAKRRGASTCETEMLTLRNRPIHRFAKTETRLSTNLDFPRKSFTIFYFPDRASWLAFGSGDVVARLKDNRGDNSTRDECRSRCAGLTIPRATIHTPFRANCRNRAKERLLQEVRGFASGGYVHVPGAISVSGPG